MEDHPVERLGHAHVPDGDVHGDIGEVPELPAVVTGHAYRAHPDRARVLDCAQHVRRVPGSADRDEHVAAPPEVAELLLEDALVAHVVRERRDVADVVREGNDAEAAGRPEVGEGPLREVLPEVRRGGRAAAVAREEDRRVRLEGAPERLDEAVGLIRELVEQIADAGEVLARGRVAGVALHPGTSVGRSMLPPCKLSSRNPTPGPPPPASCSPRAGPARGRGGRCAPSATGRAPGSRRRSARAGPWYPSPPPTSHRAGWGTGGCSCCRSG